MLLEKFKSNFDKIFLTTSLLHVDEYTAVPTGNEHIIEAIFAWFNVQVKAGFYIEFKKILFTQTSYNSISRVPTENIFLTCSLY